MQQSVRNMCAKFKVDRLSCFRTGTRQVFTTQKLFPSEILLAMKTATSNSIETHFLIKIFFKSLTPNKSILDEKSKHLNSIKVFPVFLFHLSVEMKQAVVLACYFVEKETLQQVFSCEFWEISRNTFSYRKPQVAASGRWKIIKSKTLQRIFSQKLLEIEWVIIMQETSLKMFRFSARNLTRSIIC